MSAPERRPLPSPLLVVTDRHGHPRPLVETVQAVLEGGARWIWFRDRDMAEDDRRRLAEGIAGLVRAAGGCLSVGGDPDLAAALGAAGLHLSGNADPDAVAAARQRLGPAALIGVSAHFRSDLVAAAGAGADYVTLSPIFETASKPGYGPGLGIAVIHAAAAAGVPAVALGGLDPSHAPACREAGAAGLAVMGGLMRAADPATATRRYLSAWNGWATGL